MKGAGQERKQMVIKQAELDIVCGITSNFLIRECRKWRLPEIQCGEILLINGLMNRKSLARTSGQPGKHRPSTL